MSSGGGPLPAPEPEERGCCRCGMPNEAKALVATIVPFATITIVQFFAALMAHSTALLVDCASMLVDTLTYGANLWAVCAGEEEDEKKATLKSLVSSGASLAVLYGITVWGLADSILDLVYRPPADDQLAPGIVLGFGIGGLVFDAVALAAFRRWGVSLPSLPRSAAELAEASRGFVDDTDEHLVDVMQADAGVAEEAGLVNMFSALSHVVADSVRSVSSIVLGALVLADPTLNGSQCDDLATLVVGATIIAGSVTLVFDWIKIVRKYRAILDRDRVFDGGLEMATHSKSRLAHSARRGPLPTIREEDGDDLLCPDEQVSFLV